MFPDEILFMFFERMDFKTLKVCRLVNRQWCVVSSNDKIWKPFFEKYWFEKKCKCVQYLKTMHDKYLLRWARHFGLKACKRHKVAIRDRTKTLNNGHWKYINEFK